MHNNPEVALWVAPESAAAVISGGCAAGGAAGLIEYAVLTYISRLVLITVPTPPTASPPQMPVLPSHPSQLRVDPPCLSACVAVATWPGAGLLHV